MCFSRALCSVGDSPLVSIKEMIMLAVMSCDTEVPPEVLEAMRKLDSEERSQNGKFRSRFELIGGKFPDTPAMSRGIQRRRRRIVEDIT